MLSNLISLVLQSTIRKRRSSLLVFLVLLLTVACSIMSLSLTESMAKTNEELRYGAFGEWYIALPGAKPDDDVWFSQQSWAERVGVARTYGYVKKGLAALGTVDETYVALSHMKLLSGRLPEKEGEIALTERVLESLEYEQYQIGQEISFSFAAYRSGENQLLTSGKKQFTLVGVIGDYGKGWILEYNQNNHGVVEAVVTEETARALHSALETASGSALEPVAEQCYVTVARENRDEALAATKKYMNVTRGKARWDVKPCVNLLAYPVNERGTGSSDLYTALIAAVALAAVLCVYIMQLPAEVHSFAVLRSIGSTKVQLLALSVMESALLAVPALALGVPLGAVLTKLALRIFMYSGDTAVQVVVPYASLGWLFALWLAMIFAVRLVIFLVVVRTPLTGRMQLTPKKARRQRRLRGGMVALLLAALGLTVVFTEARSIRCRWTKDFYDDSPAFSLGSSSKSGLITQEFRELVESLPGVEQVECFAYFYYDNGLAGLSFDGFDEQTTELAMIEHAAWAETFPLDETEATAFEAGEFVLLCFPEGDTSPLPAGEITLHAYDVEGECVGELTVPARVMYVPQSAPSRSKLVIYEPYTVVCSQAVMKRMHAALRPGTKWGEYSADAAYGYRSLLVSATGSADQLSTGAAIEMLCKREKLGFYNLYEANRDKSQANEQTLILLYSCGGCVALVTLLLLAAALSMEAEQERRSFTILRVIGMSKRQMRRKIFGKALRRGVFAVGAGLALYMVLIVRDRMTAKDGVTALDALGSVGRSYNFYGGSIALDAALALALLAVLLGTTLLAKRGLRRNTTLK